MLRQVDVEGSVARTADAFGVSRPTFYQTQAAFKQRGIAGLVPRKRGPHGAHKLDDAVMAFVATLRAEDPALSVRALLPQIHARFGLDVHPRSLERALRRAEKNAAERSARRHLGGARDGHARGELRALRRIAGTARAR